MKKLIKLSSDHYVVVDDSEIKQNDIVCEKLLTGGYELFTIQTLNDIDTNNQFKVTHSTQPLEFEWDRGVKDKFFDKIKPLSLSEVETIYGYSVEKMAMSYLDSTYNLSYERTTWQRLHEKTFEAGFKAHQELSKDRVFTVRDMEQAFLFGMTVERYKNDPNKLSNEEEWVGFMQDKLPKTQWEVEFVDGKIKIV